MSGQQFAMSGQHVADVNILDQKMTHWHLTSAAKFFIQQLQQLGMQIFVPMAFKMQCRAMDKGDIKIPNSDFRVGTHQLFKINCLLPLLGIWGEEYMLIELNKIIIKSLPVWPGRNFWRKVAMKLKIK